MNIPDKTPNHCPKRRLSRRLLAAAASCVLAAGCSPFDHAASAPNKQAHITNYNPKIIDIPAPVTLETPLTKSGKPIIFTHPWASSTATLLHIFKQRPEIVSAEKTNLTTPNPYEGITQGKVIVKLAHTAMGKWDTDQVFNVGPSAELLGANSSTVASDAQWDAPQSGLIDLLPDLSYDFNGPTPQTRDFAIGFQEQATGKEGSKLYQMNDYILAENVVAVTGQNDTITNVNVVKDPALEEFQFGTPSEININN